MKRRTFITTTLAASIAAPAAFAMDKSTLDYKNGLVKELLAEGKTVFIDYTTDWCSTCASQRRKMTKLRDENTAYDANITFVSVDYDKFGNRAIANDYRVPRRSTLIALKGDQELGRIVAGTGLNEIKALMDAALNAATS
jgi:thiol-disulfide isomerase/thioredoxin